MGVKLAEEMRQTQNHSILVEDLTKKLYKEAIDAAKTNA